MTTFTARGRSATSWPWTTSFTASHEPSTDRWTEARRMMPPAHGPRFAAGTVIVVPRGHLAARRCGLPNAAPEEPRGPAPWWPRDLLPHVAGPHRLTSSTETDRAVERTGRIAIRHDVHLPEDE